MCCAAEYYRDVLGFKILGCFLQPPVYAVVARDAVKIHFGRLANGVQALPNVVRKEGSVDAYIWTDVLDLLYRELEARAAKIVEAPTMRGYKCYEMVVGDKFGFPARVCSRRVLEPWNPANRPRQT